jgi:ribose transport system substrate-binding protein
MTLQEKFFPLTPRRRKAVWTVAGALAASTLLAGCATANAVETGVSADTSIELIAGSQASSYSLSLECGAAQEARRLGVNLVVAAPDADTVAGQQALVNGVIVGNPDALIIDPASTTALDQSLVVAQENDTKIVFVGVHPVDHYLGASLITSDDTAGGKLAADNLGPLVDGHGTVAVITAPDGGSEAAARIAGFQRELASRDPGVTVLPVQSDPGDTAADAAALVTSDLKAQPDLAGVLTLTDNTTQGAEAAISKASKTGTVKLATFDASPLQMTGLDSGAIQVAVAQEPAVEGAESVEQAVNAVAQHGVQPDVSTPMIAITPKNMNSAAVKPYIYDGTCTSSLRGYMTAGD